MRVSICALELFSTFTHGFSQSNIESFVVIIIINNFFTPFFHLKILFEQLFNFAIVISTIEDHFSVAKKIGRRDARTKMATSTMNFKPQILTKKATRQARSILQRKRDFGRLLSLSSPLLFLSRTNSLGGRQQSTLPWSIVRQTKTNKRRS